MVRGRASPSLGGWPDEPARGLVMASSLARVGRRAAYAVLGSRPASSGRLSAIRRAGRVTILNLHRVSEDDGSGYKPLHPRLFEQLLDFLDRHYAVSKLGELGEPSSTPKAVLSFDDGYKDFVEVVAPILDQRGIRANINVIPACIESGRPPLNVLAQDFVGKAPASLSQKVELSGFGRLAGPNLPYRLSAFLKNRPEAEQRAIEEELVPQFFRWDEFAPTPMMSLEEVRQIARRHEVGVHSYGHATMGCETEAFFQADLDRCRTYFRERLDLPVTIYAFPNGSYTDAQLALALRAGIAHVLLVGEDFSDGGPVHKRFTFGATSLAEMRFRALGAARHIA